MLQSCLTAADGPTVPSVARSLLDAGIPVVLAMGQSVSVPAAKAFFRAFYTELARGREVVEATRRARLAVADDPVSQHFPWEWATPILMVRRDAPEEAGIWRFPEDTSREPVSVDERPRFSPPDPGLRRNPFFVGRRKERVDIARSLDPDRPTDRPVVVLHGERGIGKTALAVEAIFRWGHWFDDPLWLQGRSEPVPRELAAHLADYRSTALIGDIGALMARLADMLRVPRRGDEPPAALVEPILAALADGRKHLLVLDNMDAFIGEEVLLDLLRRLPAHCRALLTCPTFPEGLDAQKVGVRGLAFPEALALMVNRAEGEVPPGWAEKVYRRAGGHPMTLRLVVGWVKSGKRDWDGALKELEGAQGDLFEYVFSRSLAMAGDEGRRLFRLLALFDPDGSRAAWQAVAEAGAETFGDTVALLVGLSLVEDIRVDGVAFYGLSPLARAVAEREMTDAERAEGPRRFSRYYRRWLEEKSPQAPGTILEKEAGNIRRALEVLYREEPEHIRALLDDLLRGLERAFTDGQNRWAAIQPLLPPGLVVVPPDWQALRGRLMDEMVEFCHLHGYWPQWERLLQMVLAVLRALGDRHGEAQTLGNLGNLYRQQGRLEEALDAVSAARRTFEELGDAPNLVLCYRLLARVHRARGEVGEALPALVAAVMVALQVHPKPVEETLDNVVATAKALGEQGEWRAVDALGAGVLQLLEEMVQRGLVREEMGPVAALVRATCGVIVGVAALQLGEGGEEERGNSR